MASLIKEYIGSLNTCKYMSYVYFQIMRNNTRTDKEKAPHYNNHRERLRNRYLNAPGGFAEYELLELLLTYAIPRIDVKPLAKELLAEFGSLSGVLNTSDEELSRFKGIGPSTLVFMRLIRDMGSRILAEKIKNKGVASDNRQPRPAPGFKR